MGLTKAERQRSQRVRQILTKHRIGAHADVPLGLRIRRPRKSSERVISTPSSHGSASEWHAESVRTSGVMQVR
jgi:hypothetical protein